MFRTTRKAFVFAVALGCALAAASGHAGNEAPTNTVVASGGGTVTQGSMKLHWTVGEPVAGPTSAGGTTLTAGFQATFTGTQQGAPTSGPCSIFCNGFEN